MFSRSKKSNIFAGFGIAAAVLGLSASAALASTQSATFGVTASVAASCSITADSLNFGAYDGSTTLTPTSTVSVNCTNTTPYNVGLNAGTGSGATTTTRVLTGTTSASNKLNYTMWQNSARTTNWGNTVGTDTESGTGSGSAQSLTVYGQLASGQTANGDSYTDTITATLTF